MAGTKDFVGQAKQFWASRTGRQRGFLIGGVGATLLLLALFTRFLGSPDYKPLFTDLEPADAQSLSAQLDAQGIPHQTSPDGKTISVPADRVDAARMQTAAQGTPRSGRMGFELFDKMSWGQTEFDEKVNYQRALEGELERSIDTLADVESARVHLVMPTDSVFLDRQRPAKASVVLKLKRGTLSRGAVLAISRLVSGAVDQLRPEDVSIVDADTDRSLGLGQTSGNSDGDGSDLTAKLIATLEPIVGTDKIRANVNVEYDQGTTEESQEKYDPTVSAVLSEQKSQDQAAGPAAQQATGVPGTSSNIPSTKKQKPAPPAAVPTQSSASDTTQYGVNRTVVHTVMPAGRVQRITAAILIDDAMVRHVDKKGNVTWTRRRRTADEIQKIQALAEAAIGYDAKRGDTISVQNLPFDESDTDVPTVNWATKAQKTITGYSSIMRPVSLLVLFVLAYLFLLRPIQKQALGGSLPAIAAGPELTAGSADGLPSLPEHVESLPADAIRAARLRQQTSELIRQKPAQTARALQAWLNEEPS